MSEQVSHLSAETLRQGILQQSFYARPAELVARAALGRLLVHESPEGLCAGRIVEAEAYLASGDPGCHAAGGRTDRNEVMFRRPGTIYVYIIHTHALINAVTGAKGLPEAVLIRALEPVAGVGLMKKRRGFDSEEDLCSGPGKLTEALGITKEHNRRHLTDPPVYLADSEQEDRPIGVSGRIGLSEGKGDQMPLRYYYQDSTCLSR